METSLLKKNTVCSFSRRVSGWVESGLLLQRVCSFQCLNQLSHRGIACLGCRFVTQIGNRQVGAVATRGEPDDGEPVPVAAAVGESLTTGPVAVKYQPAESI